MAPEVTLGNANLLRLVEALALNAERVQFDSSFNRLNGEF